MKNKTSVYKRQNLMDRFEKNPLLISNQKLLFILLQFKFIHKL